MKIRVIATLLVTCAMFGSVFARNPMVEQKVKIEVKADSANATLVVFRTTSLGSAAEIPIFVDQKYIGTSVGKCYIVKTLQPGRHYIISELSNRSCVRFDMEAGKIYYLQQQVIPAGFVRPVASIPQQQSFFNEQFKELDYLTWDQSKKGSKEISAEDWKETVGDFEKECIKDPAKNKDIVEYKGF